MTKPQVAEIWGYTRTILGRHVVEWEWRGEPHWPTYIHSGMIANDALLDSELPWKLIKVGSEPFLGDIYFRADIKRPWHRWAWQARDKAWNAYHLLQARLVMTAMIWGIGWVEEGDIIRWRCLFKKRPGRRTVR